MEKSGTNCGPRTKGSLSSPPSSGGRDVVVAVVQPVPGPSRENRRGTSAACTTTTALALAPQHARCRVSANEIGLTQRWPDQLLKIVPEDIYEDDPNDYVNPCTTELESGNASPFDYYKYIEYHRLVRLLRKVQQMKDRLLDDVKKNDDDDGDGDKGEQNVGDKGLLTDEQQLKVAFERRHGPTDFGDPLMQKRLKVMRETIEEMSSEPEEDDPKILEQLVDENIDHPDVFMCEETLVQRLNRSFPGETRKTFTRLSPLVADGEWFVIPRPNLEKIRTNILVFMNMGVGDASSLSIHNPIRGGGRGRGRGKVKGLDMQEEEENFKPLKHLHLYDPQFEFTLKMPYLIHTCQDHDEDDDVTVPKMVSFRIIENLNRFPNGISKNMFWEKFYTKYGNHPRVKKLEDLNDLLARHMTEMYVAKGTQNLPDLIFPSCMEGITNPQLILKRVWHAVMCLLAQKWYLKVNDVFAEIKRMHGFHFKPRHWNFGNRRLFLEYCINLFCQDENVTVYRQLEGVEYSATLVDYIMINSDRLEQQIGELHGMVETVKLSDLLSRRVANHYLNEFDRIDSFSNRLSRGDSFPVDIEILLNPHEIFAVQRTCLQKLRSFHDDLQIDKEVKAAIFDKVPNPRDIKIGMYVIAKLTFKDPGARWFRCRIIRHHGSEFVVYGIDWGFHKRIELKNIRHMPRGKVSEELAYAIPMKLRVAHPLKKKSWEGSSTDLLDSIIGANVLHVELVRSESNDEWGCLKWIMNGSVVSNYPFVTLIDSLTIAFYTRCKTRLLLEQEKAQAKTDERKAAKDAAEKEADCENKTEGDLQGGAPAKADCNLQKTTGPAEANF